MTTQTFTRNIFPSSCYSFGLSYFSNKTSNKNEKIKRINFLTCGDILEELRAYSDQPITKDDAHLIQALKERNIEVKMIDWEKETPDQLVDNVTIIRSPWNYHRKHDKFSSWIKSAKHNKIHLFNNPDTILENMTKDYLIKLQNEGINTIPTKKFNDILSIDLEKIRHDLQAQDIVIKPIIGAAAEHIYKICNDQKNIPNHIIDNFPINIGCIAQPYFKEIESFGEISMMFTDGEFTHSVRKIPKEGDFRVQEEYGGTYEWYNPEQELIQTARKALDAMGAPLYARVDGIPKGPLFYIIEVELIEPEMFFKFSEKTENYLWRLAEKLGFGRKILPKKRVLDMYMDSIEKRLTI